MTNDIELNWFIRRDQTKEINRHMPMENASNSSDMLCDRRRSALTLPDGVGCKGQSHGKQHYAIDLCEWVVVGIFDNSRCARKEPKG